jgi:hypothetical protein
VAILVSQDASSLSEVVQRELEDLDSLGEFVSALLSPVAGVIIALMIRLVVGAFAFGLAYTIARWNRPEDYAHGRRTASHVRLWWDRVYITRAHMSLRGSWGVRQTAAQRLGPRGTVLALCNPVLTAANIILFIAFLVILTTTSYLLPITGGLFFSFRHFVGE